MSTWEDLDLLSLSFMVDTTSYFTMSGNSDEEIDFNNIHSVTQAYYEVISNTSRGSEAFKSKKKNFLNA